jgi:hypothetical protein
MGHTEGVVDLHALPRAKPGEELLGIIASRSCTGVACADCAIRRPPKSIAIAEIDTVAKYASLQSVA